MIAPVSPIEPVTISAAIVLAIVIVAATGGSERDRVTNGVIAAVIAPMVFELPFDLVVMSRTYPPVPPNPAFYRAVFFAPLFLLEFDRAPRSPDGLPCPGFHAVGALSPCFASGGIDLGDGELLTGLCRGQSAGLAGDEVPGAGVGVDNPGTLRGRG